MTAHWQELTLAAGDKANSSSGGDWWRTYSERLLELGLSKVSVAVMGDDADFIVDDCIFSPDVAGPGAWPPSRQRRGAVMGAVQSGKTASMFAVMSKCLDRGIDAIVLLSGTRTALWLQTWERLVQQLDPLDNPAHARLLLPGKRPNETYLQAPSRLYSLTPQLAANLIRRRRPLIAVVMKQVAHLENMAKTLHEIVYPAAIRNGRPFHLLVIDDEADDSSIDDPSALGALQERQVPRRILDLWERRRARGLVAGDNIFVTYLAYTATPQANFLQDAENPLAPVDFVVSLRTPGARGTAAERSSSYRVPEGVPGWYTGGEIYYKTLASVPLCIPTETLQGDATLDAVRGFLIACATRLSRSAADLSPAEARNLRFSSLDAAQQRLPPPMSMLIHPSQTMEEHFKTAAGLLSWAGGSRLSEAALRQERELRQLGRAGIEADMTDHPEHWLTWLDRYEAGAEECYRSLNLDSPPKVFRRDEWPQVKRTILDNILPAAVVSIVNSDQDSDDRPEFSPVSEDGAWRAPRNLVTIFVSGNVMSRGLTLEGLMTTLFSRQSTDSVADTQMQMQRWFGYRGRYIDLCRVVMPRRQIELFSQYHEVDESLRRDVLAAMMSAPSPPRMTVLQGTSFKATNKIGGLRARSVWPGGAPFVRYLNSPELDEANQALVASFFSSHGAIGVPDDGASQGLLASEALSLVETANLLDALVFPGMGTISGSPEQRSWEALARHVGLELGDGLYPLLRAPLVESQVQWGGPSPYAVAAYLRFWAACLERRVPGVFTTEEPAVRWSLVDLRERARMQPKFRLGLRFGAGRRVEKGPLSTLKAEVRAMERSVEGHRLQGSWGSRNLRDGEIWGDEFFDCYRSKDYPRVNSSRERAKGSDGLVLFHVVQRPSGVSLAMGVSVPVGGPNEVQASSGALSE